MWLKFVVSYNMQKFLIIICGNMEAVSVYKALYLIYCLIICDLSHLWHIKPLILCCLIVNVIWLRLVKFGL